jgi:hypothetical protein
VAMSKVLSLTGVVLLAFFASALVFVGLNISLRTQDSIDPRDASVPFDGFLITTVGTGLAVAACRIAPKLGAAKAVQGFVGIFLSFFGILAFLSLIISARYQHGWPDRLPPAGVLWLGLSALEIMLAVVWLLMMDRRTRKAGNHAEKIRQF